MTRSIKADVLSHYLDKVLDKEEETKEVELDENGDPIATKPKREITPEERATMELMQGLFMAAMSGDRDLVAAVRGKLVIEQGMSNWCARAHVVSNNVALRIGYIAGTFQPEIGNRVLAAFKARHPYFGDHIPGAHTTMMDMARVVDDQYRIAKTREEEARRKKVRGKVLGVKVPGAEDEVTSADATAMLKAMRQKEADLKAAKAAKVEAAEKARIAAEISKTKAAVNDREDAPFDF